MKVKAVQPDYEKWQMIKPGTSRQEVRELLGPPIDKARGIDSLPWWHYGYLELPSCPFPRFYGFSVGFDDNDRVDMMLDPFNGRFSADGRPSQPELIIPAPDAEFSHFPRVLDIRWFPASGAYPMSYDLELGYFPCPTREGAPPEYDFRDETVRSDIIAPHIAIVFGGMQPGRVRVKARNELGESEWSEFRYFRFRV